MEMHKISLSHVETSSVYPFPALCQTLALILMRQHFWTERFAPIGAMLKLIPRGSPPFEVFCCKLTPEKLCFL